MQITASNHQLAVRGATLIGIKNNPIDLQLFLQVIGEAIKFCDQNPAIKILPGEIQVEFEDWDDYDWCCDEVAAAMMS